ncbi:MAG: T9SS type A sorting domain-containing protein [Bacteroidales bacterium]|nr:T9SS type A sorting domain-containing protein [Bacteroidales bacterium]
MKKIYIFIITLALVYAAKAQWVDDPANNTFIANSVSSASEIRIASHPYCNGDMFVQWTSMSENGWSQKLQRLDYFGNTQWGADGIAITTPNLATWSPGYAIAALSDGSVVTMNRSADAHHWVVKINADGTTPWGTDGMMLFDGAGGGRSELLADNDGGFWALGTDMDISYLQYVNADGTLRTMATISDPAKKCTNGQLVPANDDGVFVVYAKQTIQGYTNYVKEIYVAKYNKDGELTMPETLLFSQQTVGMSYIHYAISDGRGGAYVYQWHNGLNGAYNIYVTHFNENGAPTIFDTNGVAVHSPDPANYYISAYATIDPVSHDILLVYRQTEGMTQSEYKIWINRITMDGEKPCGDGILVLDNGTSQCLGLRIDAFNFNTGFSVIYHKAVPGIYGETVEAHGFDGDGNMTWSTTMCSNTYPKNVDENTSGYCIAQNVVVWVNAQDGGLYGQNIGENGEMGEITIPVPPVPCCIPPSSFQGSCQYNEETGTYGAMLTWEPGLTHLYYNLYRQNLADETTEVIEIDAEATSYFDEPAPGTYKYQLTGQFSNSESDFALTPDGEDYLIIEILNPESVSEMEFEEIVDIVAIYNINGQVLNHKNIEKLSSGMYIVQGSTANGKIITKKIVVNN